MKTSEEQHQLEQRLRSHISDAHLHDINITCYQRSDEHKIAITSTCGMFDSSFLAEMLELSKSIGFEFYISDSCLAFDEFGMYLIIF